MADQMNVASLVDVGKFEIQRRPIPEPGPGEALIKISRVGICGTDQHIFNGHYAQESLPMIPGHEFTGRLAALGPGVSGLSVGGKAVVDMNIGCRTCFWCRRNEILNCPDMKQMGISMDGAFAEFMCVPAHLVIPAPEDIPDEVLALTEPLACVVRAMRKANVTFGQSALVIGAGPIGNLHIQMLRTIGAAPIIAMDLSVDRVAMAREMGADYGVSDPDTLGGVVFEATQGRGVDIAIECVGVPALYSMAQKYIRKGGHLAAFGLTAADGEMPLNIFDTILQENSIAGSVAGSGQDMHDALTMLAHDRIQTDAFTKASYPLNQIQDAFDTINNRPEDLKTQIVMAS